MALSIGVLGPLVVDGPDGPLTPTRPRERQVLIALALAHPAQVSGEALARALWGDRRAPAAPQTIRSHLSRLRRRLGPGAIRTTEGGYALAVADDAVDARRFEVLVADAAAALRGDDVDGARRDSGAALLLWRGTPYDGLDSEEAEAERQRLGRVRLRAVAIHAGALTRIGRAAEAVEVLEPACQEHPLDEPLWAGLITALHMAGHREQALAAYDELRLSLSRELGLHPGAAVAEAHAAVLADAPAVSPLAPVVAPRVARRLARPAVRYAERDGRAVAYVVIGEAGPPLLYLHGMFAPGEMHLEDPAAHAFLQRLARGRHVIMADLGGLGLSDPVPPALLSVEGWARDVLAVIDDAGSGTCPVVACSFGVGAALHLAASAPDRVGRLVVSGAPFKGSMLGPVEVALDAVGPQVAPERTAAAVMAPSRAEDPAFVDWLDRGGERGASPSTARAVFRMVMAVDLGPVAARVPVPTAVLHRTDAWPPGDHARRLADALPDGTLLELPGTDAIPFAGDAQGWVDAALGFIDGRDVASARSGDRLMALAVTRAHAGDAIVTAHDRPVDALRAAAARVAEARGSCAAVVHAGLVSPGPPPSGPGVDAAIRALDDAGASVLRTAAFEAVCPDPTSS